MGRWPLPRWKGRERVRASQQRAPASLAGTLLPSHAPAAVRALLQFHLLPPDRSFPRCLLKFRQMPESAAACVCACHRLAGSTCDPSTPALRSPHFACSAEAESVLLRVCKLEAAFWEMAHAVKLEE